MKLASSTGVSSGEDTYSWTSSTSRARGAGLTTHTLGTFRASGSLGTSFTLDWRKGQIRTGQPALLLDVRCWRVGEQG